MTQTDLIESLRTRFAGSFVDMLGAGIASAGTDSIALSLLLNQAHLTPEGGVHAAVLNGLGIAAGAALAEVNLKSSERASTFQTSSNMVGSAKVGETIVASAIPVHLGSRTIVVQSRVTDAAGNRLLCVVSQTLMRLSTA